MYEAYSLATRNIRRSPQALVCSRRRCSGLPPAGRALLYAALQKTWPGALHRDLGEAEATHFRTTSRRWGDKRSVLAPRLMLCSVEGAGCEYEHRCSGRRTGGRGGVGCPGVC